MPRQQHLFLPLFFLLLFLPALLGGCAGMRHHIERPRVSLADIQIRGVKALETVFLVQVRIMNPNPDPLDIRGISCDLKIDGRPFATGLSGEHHRIPAYGSALVPVPLYASMVNMVSSVLQAIQGTSAGRGPQSMTYSLTGKVRLGGNVFEQTVPFETSGTLPALEPGTGPT